MIRTQGLTHVHLAVANVERALAFYTNVFGMEERLRDGDIVFLRTPGAEDTIALRPAAEDELVGTGGGVDHIGFRRQADQDLDSAIEEVVAAGGSLIERLERRPGLTIAYVADPDGYVIEL